MCVCMYNIDFNSKSLFGTQLRGAAVACRSCDLNLASLGVNDDCFQTLPSRLKCFLP